MSYSEEQLEYSRWMEKAAGGICPMDGKPYAEHIYPEVVPCPDCGSTQNVRPWEAWGHPDGSLVCYACMGYSRDSRTHLDYHTFRKNPETGETEIIQWSTVPSCTVCSGTGYQLANKCPRCDGTGEEI